MVWTHQLGSSWGPRPTPGGGKTSADIHYKVPSVCAVMIAELILRTKQSSSSIEVSGVLLGVLAIPARAKLEMLKEAFNWSN